MSVLPANASALNAASALERATDLMNRSLSRLSSGTKAVSPADDSAGLALASRLDAQNLRLSAASTNVQNAISSVQSGESFLGSMGNVVSRLSELAGLAQDPTKSPSDLALYQQEFSSMQDQLRATIGGTTAQIGGTADVTQPLGSFNGVQLFGATAAGGQTVTVGDSSGETLTIPDVNLRTGSMLGLIAQDSTGAYSLNLTDPTALATITSAMQQLGAGQATLGAADSGLSMTAAKLSVEGENLTASLSSIRDVDVATESTAYAKYNIKVQASTAMLAQANQDPAAVLQLLRA